MVSENIQQFKRGQTIKNSLGLGKKFYSKTPAGLKKMFKQDLKDKGFYWTEIYTWKGKPDSLEFYLNKKEYINLFDGDKKELVKFLAKWLGENTIYYLCDLNRIGNKNIDKTRWSLELKTWDNYEKE